MIAVENEEAILSCLLAHPEQSAPYVCAELTPDEMATVNAHIYREILGLHAEGLSIDVPSVAGRLRDRGLLEQIGGFSRLSGLSVAMTLPAMLPEHLRAVKDKAAQRQMYALLRAKMMEAEKSDCDINALIGDLLTSTEAIGAKRSRKRVPSTKDLVMSAVTRISERHNGKAKGISTGIPALDRLTGGITSADQWVIAGPSKGGKSALAASIMLHAAVNEGKRCAFYGLEMPSVENVERLISNYGSVSATKIRDGNLHDFDFPKITHAAAALAKAPMHFRDDLFTLPELLGAARQLKAAHPDLAMLIADYAQLVDSGTDEKNREREVAVISRQFRKFSMQTGVCTVLLSQLNDDGKLRESRALGMDATKIITIELDELPTVRKLLLTQRNGVSGVCLKVSYIGDFLRFAELAEDPEPPEEKPKNRNGRRASSWHKD